MILAAQKVGAALLATAIVASAFTSDEVRDQQWHLDFLNIYGAHEISTGDGVRVGVIDTGVDGGHPDLNGRLLEGADFSIVAGVNGWEDRAGHGTAMAGLIAANGRVLGIAPSAVVLPVRFTVYATESIDIGSADAINWAVDQGVNVLCLAFSGSVDDPELQSAVERAILSDVVVIAGVGNNPAEAVQYPAAYPGVVGAAGVDENGEHARFSVVTPVATLAAPAVNITSTGSRAVTPNGYRSGSGTSDATAIIAGVAALVRARFPELSATEVVHRMTYTARDRGRPGRDDEYGYGIVDPVAALTADVPPLTPAAIPPPSAVDDGVPRFVIVGAAVGVAVLLLVGLVLGVRRRSRQS